MKRIQLAALAIFLQMSAMGAADADGEPWVSLAAESELAFSAWYEGEELTGAFDKFEVRLLLDDDRAGPVAIEVAVNVGSADMNDREINEELLEPEWFDGASFPLATFTSTAMRPGASGYLANGQLRLKGIARDLEIPLDWQRSEDRATLSGSVILSRRAWQVGTGEWASEASLADRVDVRYQVTLVPEQ